MLVSYFIDKLFPNVFKQTIEKNKIKNKNYQPTKLNNSRSRNKFPSEQQVSNLQTHGAPPQKLFEKFALFRIQLFLIYMRQQIYQPTYGVGFSTQFQQISQPTIKIVSQHSFQNQIQPNVQQLFQHQQQTSFSQQQNRTIIPINGNGSVCRPIWDQPARQRFHTSQSNITHQNQMHLADLQQIEEPWKIKVQELQRRIRILEEEQQLKQQDEDVESELSQAYSQIQQLVNTIKILQEEIQQLEEKAETKQNIIDGYDKQLAEKDKEIENANHYISELHAQLEDQTTNLEEKQKYLFDEVNTWKRKFIEQNKEFHEKQEELMALQAEVDNLKNQKIIMNKSSDYKQIK